MKKKILFSLLAVVCLITVTGCGKSDSKKMIEYLESVSFKCEENDEKGTTCTKTDGTITEEIDVFSVNFKDSTSGVTYRLISNNEYRITITRGYYTSGYSGMKAIKVENLYDEKYTCYYYPDSFKNLSEFTEGDDNHNEYHATVGENVKSDGCEYDFSKKVNEALRKFESYFSDAGFQLE